MTTRARALSILFASLSLLPTAAMSADGAAACLPRAEGGRVRLMPMEMPVLAGFARIVNPCAAAATIVSASAEGFGAVEIHETRTVDGISRMRRVPELEIPARGAVALAPGGLHLMLMRPAAAPRAGVPVPVRFTLSDGRAFTAALVPRVEAAAPAHAGHEGHGAHGH
jgi:copper(I)-binding protein